MPNLNPRRTNPQLVAVRRGGLSLSGLGRGAWKGLLGTADLTAKLAPIIVPLAIKYVTKGAGHPRRRKKRGGQTKSERRQNMPHNAIAYY